MKKLRRLDICENDFGLPRSEVPEINFQTNYPERDPNLKNNWRGRNRKDHILPDTTFEECPTLSAPLLAGSSIRKRHADETVKSGPSMQKNQPPTEGDNAEEMWDNDLMNLTSEQVSPDAEAEKSPVKSGHNAKEVWDNDLSNSTSEQVSPDAEAEESPVKSDESGNSPNVESGNSPNVESGNSPLSAVPDKEVKESCDNVAGSEQCIPAKLEEEDWDNEIIYENNRRFNGTYRHPIKMYRADVDPHFFLPSDIHVPPIHRDTPWFGTEHGQFDDADDL